MIETVKGCPWCGTAPELLKSLHGGYVLKCANDSCPVQPQSQVFSRKDKLIEKWNKIGYA